MDQEPINPADNTSGMMGLADAIRGHGVRPHRFNPERKMDQQEKTEETENEWVQNSAINLKYADG